MRNLSECLAFCLLLVPLAWLPATAAESGIPSCYASLRIAPPAIGQDTELFVLVDQTVVLDAKLQQAITAAASGFVRPGNVVRVVQFSAFNQGRYTEVVAAGALERPLPKTRRDDTGALTLARLDKCLVLQQAFGRQKIARAIVRAMEGASPALSRSDIVASLHEVSRLVRASQARDRVVLLVSDMLENSTIANFYRGGGVRRIVPDTELKAVGRMELFGDFGGARIFVIGAGLLPEQNRRSAETPGSNRSYRDPVTIAALTRFWQGYFSNSNARLIEFGTPALLVPMH